MADIGDEESVAAMFRSAAQSFPGRAVDIVVAVGGLGISAPFQDSTLEQFESVINTNLIGSYLTMRHAAQSMVRPFPLRGHPSPMHRAAVTPRPTVNTDRGMRVGSTLQQIESGKGGKIITVSSIHGLGASHRNGMYSATKAGIIALTKSAAYDLVRLWDLEAVQWPAREHGGVYQYLGPQAQPPLRGPIVVCAG